MSRSKIALLYVGGSIGMKVNQKTGCIEPLESLSEVHRFLPELQKEVSLQFFSVANVGSSEINPSHWEEIALLIRDIYEDFDGFVVVHGTNTMSYTAAALSFALQGLSKPVVLTGALLPINDLAGDGRMNLVFAIRTAQLDIAEVCIALGPNVLRGTRAKKVEASFLQTFESPNCMPLADFSREVSLADHRIVRRKRTLNCTPSFNPNVVLLSVYPGMPEAFMDSVLAALPDGIILRTYGPGMLSKELFPWLQKVTEAEIPICITSQALRGMVDLHKYRKQLVLEKLGIISGKNMTFECAVVKMMWALTQSKDPRKIRNLMEKNIVGEMDD
ncbi:asparaginase [Candidatus Peregrinibacteria bacterium]|jgi:L-asparaginase|nr:asparaginase [Candidatus Peregrinibacteria bacterium]MBT5468896.1 asparaginase [Candidatus Peregrinibacteria bacterium]MBT7337892.1 asparaginase [Candidatus Peregrinibacteria bacterium]